MKTRDKFTFRVEATLTPTATNLADILTAARKQRVKERDAPGRLETGVDGTLTFPRSLPRK